MAKRGEKTLGWNNGLSADNTKWAIVQAEVFASSTQKYNYLRIRRNLSFNLSFLSITS